jgi:hypothetical protein
MYLVEYEECRLWMCRRVALIRTGLASALIESVFLHSVLQLLITASAVLTSLIHFTLMTKAIQSSETSVLTRATRRHIAEDGILHSHRRENIKSYILWSILFEVFTAVTMKNGVFWDVTPRVSCENRRFGGT